MPKFDIKWLSPEYEHQPKDASWYWTSVVIALVILALAVWQANYLFALFIMIAEVLIIVWASRPPRMVPFRLTEKELIIDGKKSHLLSDVIHWSHEDPEHSDYANYFLHLKHKFHFGLKMHVPRPESEEVRRALRSVLPEVKREESWLDIFDEFVGF